MKRILSCTLLLQFLLVFSFAYAQSLSPPKPLTPETGEELYHEGLANFNQGKYQEALSQLEQAIRFLTNYDYVINAHKTMAITYLAFSQKANAVEEFVKILRLNSNFTLDRITESPKVIEAFDEAQESLIKEGFLAPNPPQPSAPSTQITQGESAAVNSSIASSAAEPEKPTKDDLFKEAQELYANQLYEQAADKLAEATYEDPSYVQAYLFLAQIYNTTKGKHLTAIDQLHKALSYDPDNTHAIELLASIYVHKTQEYDNASVELHKLIKLEPYNALAHQLLGIVYYRQKLYPAAIKELLQALTLDPQNASSYNYLGRTFEEIGNLPDALLEYETAIRLDPHNGSHHRSLALAYELVHQRLAATREWLAVLSTESGKPWQEQAKKHLSRLKRAAR